MLSLMPFVSVHFIRVEIGISSFYWKLVSGEKLVSGGEIRRNWCQFILLREMNCVKIGVSSSKNWCQFILLRKMNCGRNWCQFILLRKMN